MSDPWNPIATVAIARWTARTGTTCANEGDVCDTTMMGETLSAIPTALICAAFATASGVGHFIEASDPEAAEQRATKGVSAIRWVDYGVSASLMMVILNTVCGVVDVGTLAATSGLMAALMGLVGAAESTENVALATIATVLYPAVWAPALLSYFGHRIWPAAGTLAAPPFVDVIVATLFAVFSSFAIVFWVQWFARVGHEHKSNQRDVNRVPTFDASLYSLAYAVLSLVAKTALHWTLFVSLLGRKGRVAQSSSDLGTTDTVVLDDVWTAVGITVCGGLALGVYFTVRIRGDGRWKRP